jgi:fatty-acyl-CoA synthase
MDKFKVSNKADIEEIEKIPIEDRLPYLNTFDLLRYGVSINPSAKAISFVSSGDNYHDPVQITYRDLLKRVTQTANLFHDLGAGKDDAISLLLPNLLEIQYVMYGGQATGIVNPINFFLEPSAIVNLCKSAKTKILVVPGEGAGEMGIEIMKKAIDIQRGLPSLKGVVVINGPSDEKNGIYGYEEFIDKYRGDQLDSTREIAPDDKAVIYYTGGTTGIPKLAPRSHFNEVCMAYISNMFEEMLDKEEAYLGGAPFFHTLASASMGTMIFSVGAHLVMLSPLGFRDRSVPANFFKIIEHYGAVGTHMVPTMLFLVLDVPVGGSDISSFRWVYCGGAPLSPEVIKKWEEKTHTKIVPSYGLTEATTFTAGGPMNGVHRFGSVGLRYPYVQQKIFILNENGSFVREAKTDEIGSICVNGPTVFKGYVDPKHNEGVWPKPGWFNTGDLGREDKEGYFWHTGRSKDLIRRSGHNIDPAVIEHPLYKLKEVHLAAAVPKPDRYAGEVACLYVQLKNGADLTVEQIMDYLKQNIGERAAIPKEIVIQKSIPLTGFGKVFKPALHWDAIRRAYENELSSIEDRIEWYKVKVTEDKMLGRRIIITVKLAAESKHEKEEIEKSIREILAPFSFPYRVVMF